MKAIFVCILLVGFACANKEHEQAELRERLSKAKTMKEALSILRSSDTDGPQSLISPESLEREEQELLKKAKESSNNPGPINEARNGGCEPRVICKTVPVDRETTDNIMSVPQCIEVHECGGCCQEPQFTCTAIEKKEITFGPLLLVHLDRRGRRDIPKLITMMNHTKCECRCNIDGEECRQIGQMLDKKLCRCVQPICNPACPISATCSIVPNSATPRCTCRRRLSEQYANYCRKPDELPNRTCSRCERI